MKTTSKRFLIALLTLVMAFSLAIPALADEAETPSYTVDIYPNANTLIPGEDDDSLDARFDAYQIFAGELNEEEYKDPAEDADPLDQSQKHQLSNVTWGNGVKNLEALIEALKKDETFGAELTKALKEDMKAEDAASVVAGVIADLSSENKSSIARAFAKIVAEKDEDGAYLYLNTAIPSDWADDHWTIGDLAGGYYLIVDTYRSEDHTGDEETDKANSDFLVGVYGNTKIYVKSNVPAVDKVIVDGENTAEGTDAELGELVTFRLTGTLPENYDLYDSYYYAFHDTLSKGLTYADNMTIKAYAYVGDEKDGRFDITSYVATDTENEDGTTCLDIVFADLKTAIVKDEEGNVIELTGNSVIVVEYTARLNTEATVIDAETNTVYLEYSNDPNAPEEHGKTHKEIVYVYEFGIDLFKYNAQNDIALEGAGFSLTKAGEDGTTLYATFKQDDNGYYIDEWVTLDETPDWSNSNLVVTSDEDGKLKIRGLEAGVTYSLTEVVTPVGFDTLERPITVKFDATYYGEDTEKAGQLESLTATIVYPEETKVQAIVVDGEYGNYTDETPFASFEALLNVANVPSGWLPGTGGPGVILFYVGGILLLAGGTLYLVLSAVKKKKVQEQ